MTPLHAPAEAGRIDFASRLSARAITAGVLVALTTLGVLMVLGGGFGAWSIGILDAEAVRALGAWFAFWSILAWGLSLFLGSLVSAIACRSGERRDGLLQGITTWAASSVAVTLIACTWLMAALAVGTATPGAVEEMGGRATFWACFIGDVVGLVGALLGGVVGARYEARTVGPVQAPVPAPGGGPLPTTPSPQPT
ncbi:MAG: hypothetical protein HY698_09565 [Deltaproteobacteria bacterium]|nr:hypothetical protein [Deltaproteobacteria bacterium]